MSIERAIAVSPRKSGTHLLQELLVSLGYRIRGESVPPRDGIVGLSLRERLELAERFLHPDELAGLDLRGDRDGFVDATNRLWNQLAEIWEVKLAAINVSNTELSFPELRHRLRMAPDAWRRPFSDTPADICWTFHSLDLWRLDHGFYAEWQADWVPRLMLNYRDPRDTLISMVNFFSGASGHTFSRQPELAVFRPILQNLPELADRITYVLRDPAIPLLADFESAITLLYHPRVCTVSFEELVGPYGGGDAARQIAAVQRIADHLQVDTDAAAVAEKVYNPNSFSFHRGQIGAWRELFTRQHSLLFASRFGHLLELFDYA